MQKIATTMTIDGAMPKFAILAQPHSVVRIDKQFATMARRL